MMSLWTNQYSGACQGTQNTPQLTGTARIQNRRTGGSVSGATISTMRPTAPTLSRDSWRIIYFISTQRSRGRRRVKWKGTETRETFVKQRWQCLSHQSNLPCREYHGASNLCGAVPRRMLLAKKNTGKQRGWRVAVGEPHHEACFSHADLRSSVGGQGQCLFSPLIWGLRLMRNTLAKC